MLVFSPAHEPVHRQPDSREPDRPRKPQGPSKPRQQRSPSQPRSQRGPDRKSPSRKPQRHRSAPAGAPQQEPRQAVDTLHTPSIGALPN